MAKSKGKYVILLVVAAVIGGVYVYDKQATVSSLEELYADAPPFWPKDRSDRNAVARVLRETQEFNKRCAPIVKKDRRLTRFFKEYFAITGSYPGAERINYSSPELRAYVRIKTGANIP